MSNFSKNLLFAVAILMILSAAFSLFEGPAETPARINLSELAAKINEGAVSAIEVRGDELRIALADDKKAVSQKEAEVGITETLRNFGVNEDALRKVNVAVQNESGWNFWAGVILPTLLPLLVIGFIFWLMFRQARTGVNQAFSFGRSNIKLSAGGEKTFFKDVAGLKEAKEELMEVVEFLKNPKKFTNLGAKIPRGVLLVGAPGTGKTMLARAVAGESNVPFFHMSASEFVEMFVGVGASVAGNTPVLIRDGSGTRILSIQSFADQYYTSDHKEGYRPVTGVSTLGFKPKRSGFWGSQSGEKKFFGGSQWTKIEGVYRHKVNEIYRIHYRGGAIETTGDHSIFVRSGNMIAEKRASELAPGEMLVNLPFKVRGAFLPGLGTTHHVRAHEFSAQTAPLFLDLYQKEIDGAMTRWSYVFENRNVMTQKAIGAAIGMTQGGVKDWQIGNHMPRIMHSNLVRVGAPSRIEVTEGLMRLLGYYTAEGHTTRYSTTLTFGLHEKNLHRDCANLIEETFCLKPRLVPRPETNSLQIIVASPHISAFFARHCGNGSRHKHIPEFLWDSHRPLFLAYLKGYSLGDGYTRKEGKLCMTSVSQGLIRELAWLSAMHGIPAGIRTEVIPAGRIINGGKPIPASKAWTLIIGKTAHPFKKTSSPPSQLKKPVIKKIEKVPYDGYVYDLCGCEHEAFFGGEKPVLLHNSRIRDAFGTAKKAAPSILFIDEIDAIGRQRGAGMGGGNDEREQTLNQILVELDGFEQENRTIIISASNRPDVLDPALLRPGRFDRRVVLDLPDLNDREAILKIHVQGKTLEKSVDLRRVAQRTAGFSGADLANLTNEAAILAARGSRKAVAQEHLYDAVEKVILGPERRTRVISDREKEITAYHEGGHALVAASFKDSDKVHKVSIISRGFAGGYTMKLPEEDQRLRTKRQFLTDIAVMMAGYASEKLMFGDISTGAANDLKNASELTRKLVTKYGMSDLGPITFGGTEEMIFLGREIATEKNYSEKIAAKIDEEIGKIISYCHGRAEKILAEHKKALHAIAKTLMEKETLEQDNFYAILKPFRIKPVGV